MAIEGAAGGNPIPLIAGIALGRGDSSPPDPYGFGLRGAFKLLGDAIAGRKWIPYQGYAGEPPAPGIQEWPTFGGEPVGPGAGGEPPRFPSVSLGWVGSGAALPKKPGQRKPKREQTWDWDVDLEAYVQAYCSGIRFEDDDAWLACRRQAEKAFQRLNAWKLPPNMDDPGPREGTRWPSPVSPLRFAADVPKPAPGPPRRRRPRRTKPPPRPRRTPRRFPREPSPRIPMPRIPLPPALRLPVQIGKGVIRILEELDKRRRDQEQRDREKEYDEWQRRMREILADERDRERTRSTRPLPELSQPRVISPPISPQPAPRLPPDAPPETAPIAQPRTSSAPATTSPQPRTQPKASPAPQAPPSRAPWLQPLTLASLLAGRASQPVRQSLRRPSLQPGTLSLTQPAAQTQTERDRCECRKPRRRKCEKKRVWRNVPIRWSRRRVTRCVAPGKSGNQKQRKGVRIARRRSNARRNRS